MFFIIVLILVILSFVWALWSLWDTVKHAGANPEISKELSTGRVVYQRPAPLEGSYSSSKTDSSKETVD